MVGQSVHVPGATRAGFFAIGSDEEEWEAVEFSEVLGRSVAFPGLIPSSLLWED